MKDRWGGFNSVPTDVKRRTLLAVMLRGFTREGVPDDAPPVIIAREWLEELRAALPLGEAAREQESQRATPFRSDDVEPDRRQKEWNEWR